MKLSRLYCNKSGLFGPIDFVDGLNVVLAEIRLPENKNKDTHNLGKSVLGRLLDFTFLAGRDPNFFLFRYPELFQDFVFYLEVELYDASFLTIRRSVAEASKISFKKHDAGHQDFTDLDLSNWDHPEVAFDRARELLDALLDLRGVKPWTYRKGLGYLLRSQDDYRDVFQLQRFAPGKHADWKPFLAHVLGFNSPLIAERYEQEESLVNLKTTEQTVKDELGGTVQDISKVEGMLLLKQKEAEKKQRLLDAFDFRNQDKERTKNLVDEIDAGIAELNSERYSKGFAKKKIAMSLAEDQILFSAEEAEKVFKEAGVLFEGQIKVDFEQLIAFNKSVTEERRQYLQEELGEIEIRLKEINAELSKLGKKRSDMLAFLSSTDVFNKYKVLSNDLVALKADLVALERQKTHLHRLQELRARIREIIEHLDHLQVQIEDDVEEQNSDGESLFSTIRLFFSEIVEDVINRKALLSASINQAGHIEFKAEILDETGNATSADDGHTYKKLMCVAFDLAVLRGHLDSRFPKFAYHDGIFESLDDRKKENLIAVIRDYMQLGLQLVITTIDSDLPASSKSTELFDSNEVILHLHDEGIAGRLFRMKSW